MLIFFWKSRNVPLNDQCDAPTEKLNGEVTRFIVDIFHWNPNSELVTAL